MASLLSFMRQTPLVSQPRRGRVPTGVLAALALAVVAGLGVWYLTRETASKTVAIKDLPQGRVLAVTPLESYVPKLSEAESKLLHDGPDGANPQSVKAYLLAKAKLEADPLTRTRLEQEAIALTDGYGSTPPVTEDNAQVRSVIAALKDGKHPERLNPLIAPKPFDEAAYKADPQAYLDVAEPGRVFQTKPAAAGVARLESVSPYWQDVKQGESVELAVKALPGAPVTFTSFDCGKFGNGLTTQTVAADAAGVARVRFHGVPGTVLETNILAASPMTSGQARFKTNTLVYADGQQVAVK